MRGLEKTDFTGIGALVVRRHMRGLEIRVAYCSLKAHVRRHMRGLEIHNNLLHIRVRCKLDVKRRRRLSCSEKRTLTTNLLLNPVKLSNLLLINT